MECDGGQMRQGAALPWRRKLRLWVGERDFTWWMIRCKISSHIKSVVSWLTGNCTCIFHVLRPQSEVHTKCTISTDSALNPSSACWPNWLKHKISSLSTEKLFTSFSILSTYSWPCEWLSSNATVSADHDLWRMDCGGGFMLRGCPHFSSQTVTVFKFR